MRDCVDDLQKLIEKVKTAKPNDRSGIDRKFAIMITDLEKTEAYLGYQIVGKWYGEEWAHETG